VSLSIEELRTHLEDNGCHIDDNGRYHDADFWINCISGDICYIEHHQIYSTTMCCHIFYELRIPPPYSLEDDYEIYKLFRKDINKNKPAVKKNKL